MSKYFCPQHGSYASDTTAATCPQPTHVYDGSGNLIRSAHPQPKFDHEFVPQGRDPLSCRWWVGNRECGLSADAHPQPNVQGEPYWRAPSPETGQPERATAPSAQPPAPEIERIEALMRDWKDLCAIDGNSPGISWHPPLDTAPPILHKLHRWRGIASGLANAFHALLEERKELLRRVEEAEKHEGEAIDERDSYEAFVGDAARAAGCEREWSSLHSHRDCVLDACRAANEHDALRAQLAEAERVHAECATPDEVAHWEGVNARLRAQLAEAQAAIEASASSQERAVAEAYEKAAKACEGELLVDPPHDDEADEAYDTAVRHCAAAIRALAPKATTTTPTQEPQ